MIQRASFEDVAEILALQKLAYQSEAELYNDYDIPPLRQSLAEMQREFSEYVILKLSRSGKMIGSVRAAQRGDTCYIGRLIVHPEHQGQGLGTQLLQAIEEAFPGVDRFELFTGSRSERNNYFYQKCGYKIFDERHLSGEIYLNYLEKKSKS